MLSILDKYFVVKIDFSFRWSMLIMLFRSQLCVSCAAVSIFAFGMLVGSDIGRAYSRAESFAILADNDNAVATLMANCWRVLRIITKTLGDL